VVSALDEVINDGVIYPEEKVKVKVRHVAAFAPHAVVIGVTN